MEYDYIVNNVYVFRVWNEFLVIFVLDNWGVSGDVFNVIWKCEVLGNLRIKELFDNICRKI